MSDFSNRSPIYVVNQKKSVKAIFKSVKHDRRQGRPFVTISREPGAYGMTVAEALAAYLQDKERREGSPWTVFDKDIVKKVMSDHHLPEEFAAYFSECAVSEIEDILEELFSSHPSQWSLVHKMNDTILRLAQLGYVILVGRGANIITRRLPRGFHVRLIGSFEKRVEHMQEYLKMNEKKTRACLVKEQKDRRSYVRKYFSKDINDPSLYDLVINTDTVPVENAVRLIGDEVLRGCGGAPAEA
ncbi:MAG: cytidylate kinase-like family protein [Candidatus Omnitrophota bacterium]|nr:cytidylate kinase-like family protein [Candidatus Omnitrophota bacterium]MDZ4243421.1 cytidylate kinase-like family protein [Candidatus Omnitrophota bacterium]